MKPYDTSEVERVLAVSLCALLRKHRVIDAAAVDDPEGYDNYETMGKIKQIAEDLAVLLTQ